ncbi:MAG: hypothetical protein EZS28_032834 [Streblomastix strix]|uniref:Uncharacterized protein n=1 Tax=Streblomastix strix TaxID=222440 RepID=A0A5J4UMA2_9EUKA|nr:MAG: hypothetical protein EZS28_032834 [Streblomastix strix]
MSKKGKKGKKKHSTVDSSDFLSEHSSNPEWKQQMQSKKGQRQIKKQKYDPTAVAKIPDIMLARGLKLRKGMSAVDKRNIEDEIMRVDPTIRPVDAMAGVLGLTDHKARRLVYRPGFPNSLLQDLYETDLRVNNEGRLIQEKYVENAGRYEENINARIDQPSMNLGSHRPVVTEEQQLNEIMNFGSHRQKEKESQSLNQQFPTESQEDLGQSSMFQDQPPEITVAQEKLTEKQRQAIQKDILKSENLNTVYDIGALDWGRPPINDIYGRNPFETYKTGYKYDALGNPQAYMKIDTPVGSKKQTKMKKNYIPTSQLISTSTAQEKLAQNWSSYGKPALQTGKPKKKKAKK